MSLARCTAAVALACALVGCRDSSQETGPAAKPRSIEEQVHEHTLDLHEQADVVFEGTVISIRYLESSREGGRLTLAAPPDTVVTSFDPRFLVTIRVETVLKGNQARQWSGEKPFAIHSPARDLGLSIDEGAGRRIRIHLFDRHQDENGLVSFSALYGRAIGEEPPAPPPKAE